MALTKEQIAIALYGLFDRLWVKSKGVISKEESRALMEAAQFFQNEANVVAVVEPACNCIAPKVCPVHGPRYTYPAENRGAEP
jgi:hypothetical protein